MLDAFLQDLRYAVRALRTTPGFAAVAILSLALGIGANTAIFSLIDSVVLKFLPVNHPEELVQITMGPGDTNFTNPIWEQVRDRQDVFSGAFAYSAARFNLSPGGEARYARGNWVSGQFFETLGVRAMLGRSFTAADDKRGCAATAVLGYDFWQKEYDGSSEALGRAISLDGHPFQIIGVVQPGFTGVEVGRGVDVYIPICSEPILHAGGSSLDQRSNWWLSLIARPKPGLDRKQVDARLKIIAPQVYAATVPPLFEARDQAEYLKNVLETEPASNGLSNIRAQYRQALWTLMVVAGTVLLIACANVANLLLARAAMRQKEIAIRMAIGAGRTRLIRQLLTESLLLSFAGAGLGILFAQWGARLLVRLLSTTNNAVLLDLTIDARVLGFTIAVAVLTGVLFGMAPAWKGTRVDPQAAMKANARGVVDSQTRLGLGKTLVAAQVALSMVLVTGAGLMLNTFSKLASLDAGFERDHVLLVNVDLRNANYPKERRVAGFEEMLDHLRAVPGVRSAAASTIVPVSGQGWNTLVVVDGFVAKSRRDAISWMNRVSPRYFETMGTPIVAGRDFNNHDVLGAPMVAVVNEATAQKFLGGAAVAVGKTFRRPQPGGAITAYEVIGVVKDSKYRSLREQNEPIIYVAQVQDDAPGLTKSFELRVEGPAASVISGVKDALAQVNKDIMLDFRSLAAQLDESLNRERLLATLSGFFGGLALLLATIGLYGVMSYNVARRRGEIGIRMALGAEQSRVLNMVLREVAILIGVGVVVGLGAAMATTRFVATFLYGIKPNDPWTLAIAAGVLAAVGVAAGFLPARRASRLDPMAALREE
ncbi:MAG TPA: ABC transporter permease [Bryobacteraceae bacterium]|jgi:putative ABC transport system permease protein|nr:ABC transporter permease [Bryobacteraceae bacterium]